MKQRGKKIVGEKWEMANSAHESGNLYSELPLWNSNPVCIGVKKKTSFEDHGNTSLPQLKPSERV